MPLNGFFANQNQTQVTDDMIKNSQIYIGSCGWNLYHNLHVDVLPNS